MIFITFRYQTSEDRHDEFMNLEGNFKYKNAYQLLLQHPLGVILVFVDCFKVDASFS